MTGENERQHQTALVNKSPPEEESDWEKLMMKTCIKHVLFLGSPHAGVKFGRATGVFPLLPSHDHSHLANSLYLWSCIKLLLPFVLSALLLWHLAVILGIDLGYRRFKVRWTGLGKVFWHVMWTHPSPEPDPSPPCTQKHPGSPETPRLFCGSTNENKGTFKVEKKPIRPGWNTVK